MPVRRAGASPKPQKRVPRQRRGVQHVPRLAGLLSLSPVDRFLLR